MYVDCHCHLDHPDFWKDVDEVIKRARKVGVDAIINNGTNPETNRMTLELAKKYDIIKPALGIYPVNSLRQEIEEHGLPLKPNVFNIDEEIEFISKQDIVSVGEVGLDYVNVTEEDKKKQVDTFQKMIELAERMKKPITIHSRKAEKEVIEILESSTIKKVIMHYFCGKKKLFKKGADNGWIFTIATNIVRSQQLQYMAEELKLSQILTETDSPYLSPFRDKRNEPAFIPEAVKKIAEIKKMDLDEMKKVIFMNYQNTFL